MASFGPGSKSSQQDNSPQTGRNDMCGDGGGVVGAPFAARAHIAFSLPTQRMLSPGKSPLSMLR